MAETWQAKVIANGIIHLGDSASLDAGKAWATGKLSELGHDVVIQWRDRDGSSAAAPAPGLEVHVTRH